MFVCLFLNLSCPAASANKTVVYMLHLDRHICFAMRTFKKRLLFLYFLIFKFLFSSCSRRRPQKTSTSQQQPYGKPKRWRKEDPDRAPQDKRAKGQEAQRARDNEQPTMPEAQPENMAKDKNSWPHVRWRPHLGALPPAGYSDRRKSCI